MEDDPILREHLSEMISEIEGFTLIGSGESVSEGKDLLSLSPEVALIDLDLIDGSGIELIKTAKETDTVKVVVITVLGDEQSVLQAFDAGADGFLLKDGKTSDIVTALEEVCEGKSPISAAAATHLLRRVRRPKTSNSTFNLTPRELELLELLAKGLSHNEVGKCLGISPQTVGTHVKAIYRKMSVKNRSEAVFEAVNEGLIRLGD